MLILFATHSLRGYNWPAPRGERVPPSEERRRLLAEIARLGFDGIELADDWVNVYALDEPGLRALGAEVAAAGLAMPAFNALRKSVTVPAVAAANRGRLLRAVEVCAALGIGLLNVSLSPEPVPLGLTEEDLLGRPDPPAGSWQADADDYRRAAEFLRDLAGRAAAVGIRLSLELHQNSLLDTADGLLRLLDLIDRPNVGANPDLANAYWAYERPPEPWEATLAKLLPRTNHVHVKNLRRLHLPGRSYFLLTPLDEGDIDYRRVLAMLSGAGYDGPIVVEGAGPGDALAILARGREYLAQLVGHGGWRAGTSAAVTAQGSSPESRVSNLRSTEPTPGLEP